MTNVLTFATYTFSLLFDYKIRCNEPGYLGHGPVTYFALPIQRSQRKEENVFADYFLNSFCFVCLFIVYHPWRN